MKGDKKTGEVFFDMGFNLGNDEEERFKTEPALNNHYEVIMQCAACCGSTGRD